MIDFLQHHSPEYRGRTHDNVAESDATVAFALDFHSAGEVLTKGFCLTHCKPYIPIDAAIITNKDVDLTVAALEKYNVKTLNIAGNSMYTLGKIMPKSTQAIMDKVVFDFLAIVTTHYHKIELIRSGGQSGADEAGLKAAIKLGIPAYCLCPKGWPYLTREGATVMNEFLFKARFDNEIKAKLFEV